MGAIFWWVIFPYITGVIMILGLFYRFTFRPISWAAPSTEFLGKRWLRIGSPLFHWGIVFAFIGHVMGIVIPEGFYTVIGVTNEMYHIGAIVGGGIAGLMVVIGLIILLVRKLTLERVNVHTHFVDYFSIISLLIVAGIGTYMTIVYNTTVVAYEYRQSIGPWFRSLFIFQPEYQLMRGVPLLFQIHVIVAFAFFAVIPFTKLVHLFSLPVRYSVRPPQQYRSRTGYEGSEK